MAQGQARGIRIHLPPDAGLGRDPAGDSYGSIRFRAEVPDSESVNERHHSHYYMMGSEALRAMTDIVTGHPSGLQKTDCSPTAGASRTLARSGYPAYPPTSIPKEAGAQYDSR